MQARRWAQLHTARIGEQLAEFEKFSGQPVTYFPRAVFWHDPGEHKTFTDLFPQGVRRDHLCERDGHTQENDLTPYPHAAKSLQSESGS